MRCSNGQKKIKVGLYGIGLDTYWGQFEGLFEKLTGYQRQIVEKIDQMGCTVVDAGMVDNPKKAWSSSATCLPATSRPNRSR